MRDLSDTIATSARVDRARIGGVCPVLATPFDDTGAADAHALARIVEFAIRCGADAIVYPGVASEVEQLTDSERNHLLDAVAGAVRGRVPLIVGASAADPEHTMLYLYKASTLGAAAAMVMAPASLAGKPDALIEHYLRLGSATTVPIMLQNAPPPASAGFDMAAIARVVAAVPAVRYVKEEAMPCGQRISALLTRPEVASAAHFVGVLGGAGARYILDELARGALGSMPACELTDIHVAMVNAWRAGNHGYARSLYNRSLPLLNFQAVFRWAVTKEVLRRRGVIDDAYVRAPGPRLDAQDHVELATMLDEIADLLGALAPRKTQAKV
ncbi:MAG: dihydrodipicolinate synthase family protein [Betaproteobacteria bacterium]|nr:MAG: dihydrodipicolinate synthase family protein [Betaproteobacteria bacterium]